ncbi:hypothetical protein JTE90_024829 [Oedothorax gibbosus]|uniref:Uncharacterized protein n=1 Tax=Oedothorax gibbosus TaxID=931172 RepID=A0AAV6TCP0_9ARAC|nr:hypothetical protein JTE90_024829 [Oedothorax gibbosus]
MCKNFFGVSKKQDPAKNLPLVTPPSQFFRFSHINVDGWVLYPKFPWILLRFPTRGDRFSPGRKAPFPHGRPDCCDRRRNILRRFWVSRFWSFPPGASLPTRGDPSSLISAMPPDEVPGDRKKTPKKPPTTRLLTEKVEDFIGN